MTGEAKIFHPVVMRKRLSWKEALDESYQAPLPALLDDSIIGTPAIALRTAWWWTFGRPTT